MKIVDNAYLALPILVGTCLPLLAVTNGQLAKAFGSPYTATFCVFFVALVGISLVILASKPPIPGIEQFSNVKWWHFIGGLIVVLNVVTFTISPSKIGVGNMVILFVSSQLISSLVLEHFGIFGIEPHTINWQRILGILCLIAGVYLIRKF